MQVDAVTSFGAAVPTCTLLLRHWLQVSGGTGHLPLPPLSANSRRIIYGEFQTLNEKYRFYQVADVAYSRASVPRKLPCLGLKF